MYMKFFEAFPSGPLLPLDGPVPPEGVRLPRFQSEVLPNFFFSGAARSCQTPQYGLEFDSKSQALPEGAGPGFCVGDCVGASVVGGCVGVGLAVGFAVGKFVGDDVGWTGELVSAPT